MMTGSRISLLCSAALIALSACSDFDIDLRRPANGLSTTDAARQATAARPRADARGIITYPDYQVVIARAGDSVNDVADRIGISSRELASFNALTPETTLRAGEVLALPRKLSDAAPAGSGQIEISTLADNAIARAEGRAPAPTPAAQVTQPANEQPTRHRVERGETAFQIARLYNVSPRALADWNGLDPEMRVREGQMLLIPVVAGAPRQEPTPVPERVTDPGAGSITPVPPSASAPLPEPAPPAREAAAAAEEARPPSPALSDQRTEASRTRFIMPVDGRVIRAFAPGRSDGIDIAARTGADVKAAAAGTVAAITTDTNQVVVVVIRHDDGLMSIYAQMDALTVSRGARVSQGQKIGQVAAADPSFLRFEIRTSDLSPVDPMRYLQ